MNDILNVMQVASAKAKSIVGLEASFHAPREACGLIFSDGSVKPMVNRSKDTHTWYFGLNEFKDAVINSQPWNLVGIYHSHPRGPTTPSDKDIGFMKTFFAQTGKWGLFMFSIYADERLYSYTMTEPEVLREVCCV